MLVFCFLSVKRFSKKFLLTHLRNESITRELFEKLKKKTISLLVIIDYKKFILNLHNTHRITRNAQKSSIDWMIK